MKIKRSLVVGCLTALLGVGAAVSAGAVVEKAPVKEAEAAVTQGQWRLNVLVETSSWWLNNGDNNEATKTQVWTGSQNVNLGRDSDFPNSDKTYYSTVTLGETSYYFATYTMNCPASSTTMYFKRIGNKQYNEVSQSISNTDNTVKIDSNGNSSKFGNYFKVILHTGVSGQNTSKSLVNCQTSDYNPAAPAIANYTFDGWYTNSGKTAAYTPAPLTGDLELWAKYTAVSYTASVPGKNPVELTPNGASATEYTGSITVNGGDILTIQKNGSTYSFSPEAASNNNYTVGGFRFGGTVTLYLKTDSGTLWADGMPTSSTSVYYLLINGISAGLMPANPENPSEVEFTGIHFNANDKINILNIHDGTSYDFKNPNLNDASVSGFEKDGTDIKCNIAGYYDLYFNFGGNSLYFGESASSACVAFSNAFIAAIGGEHGVCQYDGSTDLDDLKAAWVVQYEAWVALGNSNPYAQGIMTNKDKTAGDELAACVTMYDYVVGKYGDLLDGETSGHVQFDADFMNRHPAPVGVVNPIINSLNNDTAGTWALAIVTTVVAGVAVGGFFFIKRRKHDR